MALSVDQCKQLLLSALDAYLESRLRLPRHRRVNVRQLRVILKASYPSSHKLLTVTNDYLNRSIKTGLVVFGVSLISTGRSQLREYIADAIVKIEQHNSEIETMSLELKKINKKLDVACKKYRKAMVRVKELEMELGSISGAQKNSGATAKLLAKLSQENASLKKRLSNSASQAFIESNTGNRLGRPVKT